MQYRRDGGQTQCPKSRPRYGATMSGKVVCIQPCAERRYNEVTNHMEPHQRDRGITIMVGVLIGILLMTLFYLANRGAG
jgi:hypothetical protein